MTTNENGPPSSVRLKAAREELMPLLDVATERISRLIGETFESPKRAGREMMHLLRTRGPDYTLRILGDDQLRHWHFGVMKGQLFARGSMDQSRQSLGDLPVAIRERQEIAVRMGDLERAYRTALKREEREREYERASPLVRQIIKQRDRDREE